MLISIIVPIYNEEENIKEMYKRLASVLGVREFNLEIICVDDGSVDNSLNILKELRAKDERLKIISFSRNFGHQVAVSAGLDFASGDAVAIADADLQDPPEIILEFLKKWQEGYKVAYGIRTKRKENMIKRFSYAFFYKILKFVSNITIPLDAGDFCLMDKEIVEVLKQLPERKRFIRGLRSWAGFKQIGVIYERAERFSGKTKYSIGKLFGLAIDGIFSFSYLPLRLASWLGCIISVFSFLGILFVLYLRFFTNTTAPGFSTSVILILFLGGIQLLSLGIVGEYIGRIYEEVKKRPLYLIKEKDGFPN
jgi:polyisoprenyl-phosphate glycosyltransferase